MYRHGVGLDEPISDSQKPEWTNWINYIQNIQEGRTPRCFKPVNFGTPSRIEFSQTPVRLNMNSAHMLYLCMKLVHMLWQDYGKKYCGYWILGCWILGCSKTVTKYKCDCVVCRKLRRPTDIQQMAELPQVRVDPSPPFSYCRMDCFGQFLVINRAQRSKTLWTFVHLHVFTCYTYRNAG